MRFSAYTNNVAPAPAADAVVWNRHGSRRPGDSGELGRHFGNGRSAGRECRRRRWLRYFRASQAFAALLPISTSASNLYSINLVTGLATNLGAIDGGVIVSSMTVAPDGFCSGQAHSGTDGAGSGGAVGHGHLGMPLPQLTRRRDRISKNLSRLGFLPSLLFVGRCVQVHQEKRRRCRCRASVRGGRRGDPAASRAIAARARGRRRRELLGWRGW